MLLQIQLLTKKIQSQAVQIQQLVNENKRLSQDSGHLAEQLQGHLSGVSHDLVFASYIECANDIRHQPRAGVDLKRLPYQATSGAIREAAQKR